MLEGCEPWPQSFARLYRSEGVWRDETLGEMLDRTAERFPSRTALIAGDRRLSYSDLFALSEQLADQLVALGLEPHDRVVLQLPNIAEFVILFLALVKIGALPVMALPAHRATEISHFLKHAEAVAYAVPSQHRGFDYLALAREQKQHHRQLRLVLVADGEFDGEEGFFSLPRLLEKAAPARPRFRPDPFDVALFLLSGGTTGLPKLIPRTHADYLYNARCMLERGEFTRETVILLPIPIPHNFPLSFGLLPVFSVGGRVVFVAHPDPGEILRLIERERVTAYPAVPALHINLMDRQEAERRDVSSLRQIFSGGAKFLAPHVQRATDVFGSKVHQILGMAEGFSTCTRLNDPLEIALHTVGAPLSPYDEFRIVDMNDNQVPAGEVGELLVRGPYTLRGYYRAPEQNAKSFTADGFYRTGDVLRYDERLKSLIVEGRSKDIINRAGEKFSAEEIENLVTDHPKIQSAVLVAMPDRVAGEKGCLFVIPRDAETITLAEVVAHMEKKRVARFKFPERLEVVSSFPLTAIGKVSRRELREVIAEKIKAEEPTA